MLINRIRQVFRLAVAAAVLLARPGAPGFAQEEAVSRPEVWDGAPFAADPAAMLKAADAIAKPENASAHVLLDDAMIRFDAGGRRTTRVRRLYRVLTPAGVRDWSRISVTWAPWHQEKPSIRARVITSDGVEHVLDPNTIAEEPVAGSGGDVYSDRRVLRAPLPGVAVGALVEREITTADTMAAFDEGTSSSYSFEWSVPLRKSRLTLEAPGSLPLRHAVRGGRDLRFARRETGDVVSLTFTAERLQPAEDPEPDVPSDLIQSSSVAYSTGLSWTRVAARYGEIVDRQLAGADIRSLVSEATGAAKGREAVAALLLARLQREVRYTGIEFSEASIVPRTPREILERKYGDCKDKAALLVAMLRQAGVPAFMVLLDTGPGLDVDPELPGLGRFDHAIVYVPGSPPLWIDPTDEYARVNQLPLPDQGRLALVAGTATKGLLRTPASASADNSTVEAREFFLAEEGKSRVIETTRSTGSIEASYRHDFHRADPKKLKENLENYAKSAFLAKLEKFDTTDPSNVSLPFEIRLETAEAGRGQTHEAEAAVGILPSGLLERLPVVFRQEKEKPKPTGVSQPPSDQLEKKRLRDYEFFQPYVAEWQYKIHAPEGYVAAPLPASESVALGTARLTKSFAAHPDGTVTAVLRFDTGKRRISPGEFEQMRTATLALAKSEAIILRFKQVGYEHLAAGRLREALSEFRRLAALHPNESLHHIQTSQALIQAGLGDAARAEARKAIAAQPNSAAAYRALGRSLLHDRIGRAFRKGFDHAGALAAYRKARELEPSSAEGRAALADVLEHDPAGIQYGPGAMLADAIVEYRALRDDLDVREYDSGLLVALMWARRFEELESTARSFPSSHTRNGALVLAVAALRGPEAAIAESARMGLDPGKRREILEAAATSLFRLRFYGQAAALLVEAAKGAPDAADIRTRAEMFARTRPHEKAPWPDTDPRSPVRRFWIELVPQDETNPGAQTGLYTRALAAELAAEAQDHPNREDVLRSIGIGLRKEGLPRDVAADLAVNNLRFTVEGDQKRGWRIRNLDTDSKLDLFFVTLEDGKPKIAGNDFLLSGIGAETLRRVEGGDLEGARQWLDWAREEITPPAGDDPYAGQPFAQSWTKGQKADLEGSRFAAAVLLAGSAESERVLPILSGRLQSASSDADKTTIQRALANCYTRLKRFDDLAAVGAALLARRPDSATAFGFQFQGVLRSRGAREAQALAEERLRLYPGETSTLRLVAQAAGQGGDFEAAERAQRRLIESGKATAGDYNNTAWNALFLSPLQTRAIEDAEQSVKLSGRKNGFELHTLASLYAEVGRTTEAREALFAAMDEDGVEEPESNHWYVLGRIAEQYGEVEAALAAYSQVKTGGRSEDANSVFSLAQRRLKVVTNERARKGQ